MLVSFMLTKKECIVFISNGYAKANNKLKKLYDLTKPAS